MSRSSQIRNRFIATGPYGIQYRDTFYDDLRFPFTRDKQGQSSKPDFDFTNLGLLFPSGDDTEVVYLIAQLPHKYKLGTNLLPHLHYVQDEATLPTFKMDYRWYKNGGGPTESFTTITATENVFSYSSGSILQIVHFPEVVGSAVDTVSSFLDIKIYRDDSDIAGDVLVKEFDIHYEIDFPGSREQWVK